MKKTLNRIAQLLAVTAAGAGLLGGVLFLHSQGARADDSLPTISSVMVSPSVNGATVTWTTNNAASSQVFYGTDTTYGSASTLDTTNVTNHSVMLSGLASSTTYHFYVMSGPTSTTTASSSDMTFTTLTWVAPTTTTTGNLDTRVTNLENRVTALENWVQWLLNHHHDNNNGGNNNGGSTTTPPSGPTSIDQDGQTVRAGTNTDFGGHNFGSEEHIKVMMNGSQVASGFTNLEGGFSTGSVTVPSTAGTYIYTFTGQTSGRSASATITVIP